MLNYIRFGDNKVKVGGDLVCPFRHNARNFIVAIAGSKEESACVCASYCLYIEALGGLFPFESCTISSCTTMDSSHIFNIIEDKTEPDKVGRIGFDAGFQSNSSIYIYLQAPQNLPSDFPRANLGSMITKFDWQCQPILTQNRTFESLLAEASYVNSLEKATRNALCLEYLFPEQREFKDYIRYPIIKAHFIRSLFAQKDEKTRIYLLEDRSRLLKIYNRLHSAEDTSKQEATLKQGMLQIIHDTDVLAGDMLQKYQGPLLDRIREGIQPWIKEVKQTLTNAVDRIPNIILFDYGPKPGDNQIMVEGLRRRPCQQSATVNILHYFCILSGQKVNIASDATIIQSKDLSFPTTTTFAVTSIVGMPTDFVIAYWTIKEGQTLVPFSFGSQK
jgi:hypothetical protein